MIFLLGVAETVMFKNRAFWQRHFIDSKCQSVNVASYKNYNYGNQNGS